MSAWHRARYRKPYLRGLADWQVPEQINAYKAKITLSLVEAYRAVFAGQAANEQQRQMVVADLANFTGFYRVSPPDTPSEARAFADGQRAAFGRLFRFLRLSEAEIRELEKAALQETFADAEYGEL